ncbi:type II toxin-antitoxin system RelE/ParE family toxin [Lactobacillus sp. ESL0791]|uniref:type II toxin-antitoxin system RelE/ParE family toxin n=1 Tax=Lactobacillus sp. ESL0791 TaxID=2983234 RepID=UPI0023F98229|nr:type II toxin-antitoxin system RelE/ParE family toxin [Lactobacillus sp. ESL0791]MDF7638031.1 type II toxin-antitoxin system RelE/ParE family toxin [Lactobacillus sp. ESL0791]
MKNPKFKSYKRLNGHNEFIEFYQKLSEKDRGKLAILIDKIQRYGLAIAARMEWIKKIDKNLYEIRTKTSSNIQRVIYFHVEDEQYIITHGFTKKTNKTPKREIEHAKVIRAEFWQERGER